MGYPVYYQDYSDTYKPCTVQPSRWRRDQDDSKPTRWCSEQPASVGLGGLNP